MLLHGADGYAEVVGDLVRGLSVRYAEQDFALAPGELRRRSAPKCRTVVNGLRLIRYEYIPLVH